MRQKIAVVGILAGVAAIMLVAYVQLGAQNQVRPRRAAATDSLATLPSDMQAELVTYPSAEIAFICGPQLKVRSRLNPFAWFDETEIAQGRVQAREAPAIAPRILTGAVSIGRNDRVVTGVGTRFKAEIDPNGPAPFYDGWLRIMDRDVKVVAIQSDTQLMLASPWKFPSVNNAKADTYHRDTQQASWNYDHYLRASYYDTALVEYINYYRTGDPALRDAARKIADSLWGSPYIDNGTVTSGPNHLQPRSQALAGLTLRALDGKPEYWDYLYREVRATFDEWLKRRRDNSTLYYDLREDGYAQLYAVMLARVLPDRYRVFAEGTIKSATGVATDGARKRASLLADAEDIAVNFFGRLQQTDGSWRWDADVGAAPTDKHRNTEQPFMVGLYLESAILLHQLTRNAAVKASLRDQITRSCLHLYRDDYRKDAVADMPQYRWRGMWYFWGGGNLANPRAYERGWGDRSTNGDANVIRGVRHLNSTIHHAFGYAYLITRDPSFLQMGDEMFGASFGDATDTLRNLATAGGKEYDMTFRSSGRYLAWRLYASTLQNRER